MKRINLLFYLILLSSTICNAQCSEISIKKYTAVNQKSLTDVIYCSVKDTVLVSSYSGNLYEANSKEKSLKKIFHFDDEIYVIAYNRRKKHIAASTLENGVVIIDKKRKRLIKRLPLIDTWSLRIGYSSDDSFLFANDQRGNRFIWDVKNDYKPIEINSILPKGTIIEINNSIVTIAVPKNIIFWDLNEKKIVREIPVTIYKLSDFEFSQGELLNLNFNKAQFITTNSGVSKEVMHPSWPREIASEGGEDKARTAGFKIENNYFEDTNYQMLITDAKLGKDYFFTSSIDRSIRVWDKKTGDLIKTYTGHKATVNKMRVCGDKSQMVSIDLKGGIKFWELQDNSRS